MAIVALDDLKTYLGTDKTGDNAIWTRLLKATHAYLEGPTGLDRWLEPRIATRYYTEADIHPDDDDTLCLDDDLLAVTTLTNGDDSTLGPTTYRLLPRNSYPKWSIELLSGYSWDFDGDGEIEVAGTWAWHTDYTNAWPSSGDTVEDATGLTAAATTVTINTASNFKTLQLIKIESEFMLVTSVNAGVTPTLTVTRAQNGSTAATHAKETAISIWQPRQDAIENAIELAQYLYKLRDSGTYDVTATPELGIITIPKGIPAGVKLWLMANRRQR